MGSHRLWTTVHNGEWQRLHWHKSLEQIEPPAELGEQQKTLTDLARVPAEWTGFEPATSCVTGRHSNRLNYHSFLWLISQLCHKSTALDFFVQ